MHTIAFRDVLSSCSYACEQNYADCDGELANGCEVELGTPSACEQCPTLACLQPQLCGLSAPACQSVADASFLSYATSGSSSESFVGALAAGKSPGQVIASVYPPPTGGTAVTLPEFSGSVVALQAEGSVAVTWAARGKAASYSTSLATIKRAGDRLYIVDSRRSGPHPVAVLLVTTLDGTLLWEKQLTDPQVGLCGEQVAADAQNNVYLSYRVCEADISSVDYMLNGKSYDQYDGSFIAAFDATGAARWNTLVVETENAACRNGASTNLVDLTVANGRLFVLNDVCLAEVDVASGKISAEQKLVVEMSGYSGLRADGAGNLYVGSDSISGEVLPQPSALPAGSDGFGYPGASAVQISKYSADLKHLWTRGFAHSGKRDGVESDAAFRSFDVAPAGNGMLVGQLGERLGRAAYQPFLVAFDTDGKTTGVALLPEGNEATALTMDSAGTPFVGGTGDTVAKGSRGVFVRPARF